MAIRWKKFKYSVFSKVLAFFLAVLSVVSLIVCSFGATLFWRDFDIKNLPPNRENPEETQRFIAELGTLTDNAVDMLTKYLGEDQVKSGEAFKLTEAKIWEEYRGAVSDEVEARRNELERYKLSSEEYGDYSQYLDMNYYNVDSDGSLSVNIHHVESVLKSAYNLKIQNEKKTFLSNYNRVRKYLDSVLDLKYAVISRADNAIVSNIDGADSALDFNSVLRETYPWYMSVSSASTVEINNSHISSGSFSYYDPVRSEQTYGAIIQKLLTYNSAEGLDFYFAFDEEANSENCVFADIMRSYLSVRTKYIVLLWLLFFDLLFLILLVAYLIIVCGKESEDSPAKLIWTDMIPNSLHLIISFLPIYFLVRLYREHLRDFADRLYELFHVRWYISALFIVAVGGAVIACILLELLLSIARHVKTKTVFSDTLIARISGAVGGKLDRDKILNLKKSTLIAVLIYSIVCTALSLAAAFTASRVVTVIAVFLIFVMNISVYLVFLKTFAAFNEIRNLVSHIQQGDFDYQIDERIITSTVKVFSDKVVGINNGIRLAVDRATRDEKTKTELITNVSHDLKTPLTSIVNYVDLIKREETSAEDKHKYLAIIDEKAKQLKRLIDDLTEVSKLSGGNVEFHPVNIGLYEFALQVVGESSDDLEAAKIDMRINEPDCRPIVFADGQKTWRIMENIMSNVVKYALPNTRAYVEVSKDDNFGYITVKNVSAAPLELSGDELCARFTRGDPARSSEGFGLGLSIAKSLCELQNGSFSISVDGDLFKATIALPLAEEEKTPETVVL